MICSLQHQVKYQVNYVLISVEFLRRNPAVVRVTNRQELCSEVAYIILTNQMRLFLMFYEL